MEYSGIVRGVTGVIVYSCGIPSGMKIHVNLRNIYFVKNHPGMEVVLYYIIVNIILGFLKCHNCDTGVSM